MITENSNPLLCDIESGICEMPESATHTPGHFTTQSRDTIRVIYFTDPICSSCWGIEPQLRRLKLEYGHHIELEYRMGGLLSDWTYNSGGISKPSDVAHHWDEVSLHYDMPIDGDVWLEDPLHSSYPPSVAFKAAQMQDEQKAIRFLREIREMVFLRKLNITRLENLEKAAERVGLDVSRFTADYRGAAVGRFKDDLAFAAEWGVRGFPTMFFINSQGEPEKVYGTKPYAFYEAALLKQLPAAAKNAIDTDWQALFAQYQTLTSREFAELSQTPRDESEAILRQLVNAGSLRKLITKNGPLWIYP